ncbi:MAG: FHA domain-containing protein, partial [Pseudomonadota bacterium]
MFGIEITFPNGQVQRCHSRATSLVIGKSPGCKVVLSGWRVGHRHAELLVCGGQVFVHDLQSASGTRVNGERIDAAGPLSPDDVIVVAGHELRVQWQAAAPQGVQTAGHLTAKRAAPPEVSPHPAWHRAPDVEEAQEVEGMQESRVMPSAPADQALPNANPSEPPSVFEPNVQTNEALLAARLSNLSPLPLSNAQPVP